MSFPTDPPIHDSEEAPDVLPALPVEPTSPETSGPDAETSGPDASRDDRHARHVEEVLFSSGQKIASVLAQLDHAEITEGAAGVAWRAVKRAEKFGMLKPILGLFPPLDDPDTWDQLLALFAGVALELISDKLEVIDGEGVWRLHDAEVDVDACRRAGRELLARLYE